MSLRLRIAVGVGILIILASVQPAAASDTLMLTAHEDALTPIINAINNENVRLDISAWYLTEHAISEAIVNAYVNRHVPVRVIGDHSSIFEIDPHTRAEFTYLAQAGVPIRLRFNPWWFPFIDHWKAGIFVGQGLVEFGSANWTTFELRPASTTNYHDETALFTTDPALFNAFRTAFDQYWADTTNFANWPDQYLTDTGHSWFGDYPAAAPMSISTSRLEPDYPSPPNMVWSQGDAFNNALVNAINAEGSEIDLVIYRLTVGNIRDALIQRRQAGVQMKLFVEPNEYRNGKWPEFELTGANVDLLWLAGIPIKKRVHAGLTHMKTLVTSSIATNASSNYAAHWQRDHDYFISASEKPDIYNKLRSGVQAMWSDGSAFVPFHPLPPDWTRLASPSDGSAGVAMSPTLTWQRTKWAVYYDIYVGTSLNSMQRVAIINADMSENPVQTYSWSPSWSLQPNTTYYWQVVTRTYATAADGSLVNTSPAWSFTTGTTGGNGGPEPPLPPGPPPPPPIPTFPSPPGPGPGTPVPEPAPGSFAKEEPFSGFASPDTSTVLNWDPVDAAAGYAVCVQRSADGTCDSGWWPVQGTSLQVTGLMPGPYYWQVVALTPSGQVVADDGEWFIFIVSGNLPHRAGEGTTGGRARARTPSSSGSSSSPGTSSGGGDIRRLGVRRNR